MSKWVVAILAAVWLFSAGLLIGREMPVHHFERFGTSTYLFDSSSGYVCQAVGATPDPFAAYGGHAVDPNAGKPPDGFVEAKPNPNDKALNSEIGSIWASPDKPGATDHIRPCVP